MIAWCRSPVRASHTAPAVRLLKMWLAHPHAAKSCARLRGGGPISGRAQRDSNRPPLDLPPVSACLHQTHLPLPQKPEMRCRPPSPERPSRDHRPDRRHAVRAKMQEKKSVRLRKGKHEKKIRRDKVGPAWTAEADTTRQTDANTPIITGSSAVATPSGSSAGRVANLRSARSGLAQAMDGLLAWQARRWLTSSTPLKPGFAGFAWLALGPGAWGLGPGWCRSPRPTATDPFCPSAAWSPHGRSRIVSYDPPLNSMPPGKSYIIAGTTTYPEFVFCADLSSIPVKLTLVIAARLTGLGWAGRQHHQFPAQS